MHFYMTYYVASVLGLNNHFVKLGKYELSEAFFIAWANTFTDYHDNTRPDPVNLGNLLSTKVVTLNEDQRVTFHFYGYAGVTQVEAGSPWCQIPVKLGIHKGNPILVGIGLHIYQDSFSHAGFGSSHWKDSVPFAGRGPDIPWNNEKMAIKTVLATFDVLLEYLKKNHPEDYKRFVSQSGGLDKQRAALIDAVTPAIRYYTRDMVFWNARRKDSKFNYNDQWYRDDVALRSSYWRINVHKPRFGSMPPYPNVLRNDSACLDAFTKAAKQVPHPADWEDLYLSDEYSYIIPRPVPVK